MEELTRREEALKATETKLQVEQAAAEEEEAAAAASAGATAIAH